VQEVKLDKHIKLLDSPGIVIAKDDDAAVMSLKNCVRVETIKDPIPPVEILLKKCSKEELIMTYKITDFANVSDFLQLIARRYGKMKKGGLYDVEAAAREVIKDWNG
jgi:nuclear GTP-binding protein